MSYLETLFRLGKADEDQGFMLALNASFTSRIAPLLDQSKVAMSPSQELEWVHAWRKTLEPYDLGGFTRPDRNCVYPVLAEDLYAATDKIGESPASIKTMLQRAGFFD